MREVLMTKHQINSERTLEEYVVQLRKLKGTFIGDGVNQSLNAYDLANKIESLLDQQQNRFTFNYQGDLNESNF